MPARILCSAVALPLRSLGSLASDAWAKAHQTTRQGISEAAWSPTIGRPLPAVVNAGRTVAPRGRCWNALLRLREPDFEKNLGGRLANSLARALMSLRDVVGFG
jgi:hypothetical protein